MKKFSPRFATALAALSALLMSGLAGKSIW